MNNNKLRCSLCSADHSESTILSPRALIIEAANGNWQGIKSHLSAGGRPDATIIGKPTASGYAALLNDLEIAWILIKAGALLNYQDGSGNTACIYAVLSGSDAIFDLLLASGAELRIVNQQGKSALDYAFCSNRNNFHIQQTIFNHQRASDQAIHHSLQMTLH